MLGSSRVELLASVAVAIGAANATAWGQCGPRWIHDPGLSSIPDGLLKSSFGAAEVWDPDGDGPQEPRIVAVVRGKLPDNTSVCRVYQWLDRQWNLLAALPGNFSVYDLAATRDGRLFAGGLNGTSGTGQMRHLAQLVNGAWVEVGGGVSGVLTGFPTVFDIQPLTDGRVLVVGDFNTAGSTPASGAAIWDGEAWSPLGSGTNRLIRSAAQLDNGDIIVGGDFLFAGGLPTGAVARWSNGSWSALATTNVPFNVSKVRALPGNQMLLGGPFSAIARVGPMGGIAKFDGATWSTLGSGVSSSIRSGDVFMVTDLLATAGGDVIAVGNFVTQSYRFLARWDGTGWQAIGLGVSNAPTWLHNLPDGSVLVSGVSMVEGFAVHGIARFTYAPCIADWNSDCMLTFEDADAMIDAFAAGDPRADLNADSQLTFDDIDAFVSTFEAGCSAS